MPHVMFNHFLDSINTPTHPFSHLLPPLYHTSLVMISSLLAHPHIHSPASLSPPLYHTSLVTMSSLLAHSHIPSPTSPPPQLYHTSRVMMSSLLALLASTKENSLTCARLKARVSVADRQWPRKNPSTHTASKNCKKTELSIAQNTSVDLAI